MSIIGCDLHTRYQQIAMLERKVGEVVIRRLEHENGEARSFYTDLPKPSLIGIEATGYTQWFERMVAELGHELWVGDPAEIRARAVRRPKTDTRDAEHLLDLLLSQRFPRVWVPTPAERDLRPRRKHRDKRVRLQTSVRNPRHFRAMSQGVCRKMAAVPGTVSEPGLIGVLAPVGEGCKMAFRSGGVPRGERSWKL